MGSVDRGATPVELAILLPTILILLIVSIQAASYFLARTLAFNAAQLAVNSARPYTGSKADGEESAHAFISAAPGWLTGAEVSVERTDTEATAVVTGQVLSLLPGIEITVQQTAHGPVERFTED
ncbi:TadE/TadG family type IV pilus assembly protein [Plantactinospora sp. GCM10030261]|uniref:TadE/TadG family type IV pilus assembly protein n=1 Tax=Plantactinospora sp. GCM10030261 TaxID=3273420 RepID=UPI00362437A0